MIGSNNSFVAGAFVDFFVIFLQIFVGGPTIFKGLFTVFR